MKVGIILTTLRKLVEVVDNNSNPTGRMLKIIKFKDGKASGTESEFAGWDFNS